MYVVLKYGNFFLLMCWYIKYTYILFDIKVQVFLITSYSKTIVLWILVGCIFNFNIFIKYKKCHTTLPCPKDIQNFEDILKKKHFRPFLYFNPSVVKDYIFLV